MFMGQCFGEGGGVVGRESDVVSKRKTSGRLVLVLVLDIWRGGGGSCW